MDKVFLVSLVEVGIVMLVLLLARKAPSLTMLVILPTLAMIIPWVINSVAVPQAFPQLQDPLRLLKYNVPESQLEKAQSLKARIIEHPTYSAVQYSLLSRDLYMAKNLLIPTGLNSGDVLVEIKAASINPVDYKLHSAPFVRIMKRTFGFDFSGVVVMATKKSRFNVGDEIYGLSEFGSLAEYGVVREEAAIEKPAELSHLQAAAAVMTFKTSFEALVERGGLTGISDPKVLVVGGSGGCGIAGIQIAKFYGAHVTTITSTKNTDLVKSLGADAIIDYKRTSNMSKALSDLDFDIIYDTVGYEMEIFSGVKDKPKFISIVRGPSKFTMRFHADNLLYLNAILEKTEYKIPIQRTFKLEEANEAVSLLKSGHVTGKLVFDISS